MQKEIFEQPESVVNTMRGRVNFDDNTGETVWVKVKDGAPFLETLVKENRVYPSEKILHLCDVMCV